MISKSFVKDNLNPFNQKSMVETKKGFLILMINIIYCKSHEILEKKEKCDLLKKMLHDFTDQKDFTTFIYLLQKTILTQSPLLSELFSQ
jgi:hypothetical protein